MDRDHSQPIAFLLGGILAVLLHGREAALDSMETIFWVGLALGVVWLIVSAVVSFIRYTGRVANAHGAEVRRDREEGRPWLYRFVAWPGIIANFLVFGVAVYSFYAERSCRVLVGDCLKQFSYWWLPMALLLASIPVSAVEQTVIYFRKRNRED